MKLNRFLPALALGLPLMAAAQQSSAVPAGSAPAAPPAAPPAAATPAGQIQLDVEVTDKDGKPVAGLNRGDFTLLDNDHPADIRSFQAWGGSAGQPPQPTEIVIVIDTVNLGFQEVSFCRFGIDQFLRSDGGRLNTPVSIYWYTDTGLEGAAPPSTDGNALAAQLDATQGRLRTINRSAGEWGALERFEMSVQTLNRAVSAAVTHPGRKLLIWIGPGWPILDNPNLHLTWKDQQRLFGNIVELSTLLREGQIQIYSVAPGMPDSFTFLYQAYTRGVKKASQAYMPDLDLKVLAVESGGLALPPSNDLSAEIEKCARDANTFYTVSFTPPRADGPNEYHDLKVRLDKPGLTARTSTGYYNQPPAAQSLR